MTDADKIYEVKKAVTLTPNMQLIDLNGSRQNFQSDVVARAAKPTQSFRACVVNQEQLDNGEISFETSDNGKYARRVTFQDDRMVNHYLAIKGEEGTECSIVVRLREMPPLPNQPTLPTPEASEASEASTEEETPELANLSPNTRGDLQQQLRQLSEDPTYRQLPSGDEEDLNNQLGIAENDDIIVPSPSRKSKWNVYIIVGILCLALCAFLWWRSSGSSTPPTESLSKPSTPSKPSKVVLQGKVSAITPV